MVALDFHAVLAEWRLLALLFSRPRGHWHDEIAATIRTLGRRQIDELSWDMCCGIEGIA